MDNLTLERWRSMDASRVVVRLADHAKRDDAYVPTKNSASSRWHVTCGGHDFELLLTGPKFWDTRSQVGGGGAVDLVMHLEQLSFKRAATRLADLGL